GGLYFQSLIQGAQGGAQGFQQGNQNPVCLRRIKIQALQAQGAGAGQQGGYQEVSRGTPVSFDLNLPAGRCRLPGRYPKPVLPDPFYGMTKGFQYFQAHFHIGKALEARGLHQYGMGTAEGQGEQPSGEE